MINNKKKSFILFLFLFIQGTFLNAMESKKEISKKEIIEKYKKFNNISKDKKARKFIKNNFLVLASNFYSINKKEIKKNFSKKKVDDILNGSYKFYRKLVIDKNEKLIVIGDLHGYMSNLYEILKYLEYKKIIDKNGKIDKDFKIIFLGDLTDREWFGLDIWITLMMLKILNPESLYILAGNHESVSQAQSSKYGFFRKELIKKNYTRKQFRDNVKGTFKDQLFKCLPIACYVKFNYVKFKKDKKIIKKGLLAHGGFKIIKEKKDNWKFDNEFINKFDKLRDDRTILISEYSDSENPYQWSGIIYKEGLFKVGKKNPVKYERKRGKQYRIWYEKAAEMLAAKGLSFFLSGHEHGGPAVDAKTECGILLKKFIDKNFDIGQVISYQYKKYQYAGFIEVEIKNDKINFKKVCVPEEEETEKLKEERQKQIKRRNRLKEIAKYFSNLKEKVSGFFKKTGKDWKLEVKREEQIEIKINKKERHLEIPRIK
ncbi:hypothetical protein GF385_03900 [Candidatus Dependentiae bacterium]|nr:hypothetical protein [Candidatus Dependentiae bacterium]